MGTCTSKPPKPNPYAPTDQHYRHQNETPFINDHTNPTQTPQCPFTPFPISKHSPFFPFYTPSPSYFLKKTPSNPKSTSTPTPMRIFKRPFAPPSPAKHIRAVLRRREQGKKLKKRSSNGKEGTAIPEEEGEDESEEAVELDKRFGFSKEFTSRLEVGEEVGRGHFGYTCSAKFKKGERKGQQVAVKVIPKSKACFLCFFFFFF